MGLKITTWMEQSELVLILWKSSATGISEEVEEDFGNLEWVGTSILHIQHSTAFWVAISRSWLLLHLLSRMHSGKSLHHSGNNSLQRPQSIWVIDHLRMLAILISNSWMKLVWWEELSNSHSSSDPKIKLLWSSRFSRWKLSLSKSTPKGYLRTKKKTLFVSVFLLERMGLITIEMKADRKSSISSDKEDS